MYLNANNIIKVLNNSISNNASIVLRISLDFINYVEIGIPSNVVSSNKTLTL